MLMFTLCGGEWAAVLDGTANDRLPYF